MNKQDLIENLGTIAKSGTQAFIDQLSGDAKKDNMLIGQFGVGFYSSYMASDKVEVISKKAGEDKAYKWESTGQGEYKVSDFEGEASRGTEIIMHIKEGEDTFLDHFRLKNIIKNYSDHIAVPIFYIDPETGHELKLNSSSALWRRGKSDITEEQYKEFYKTVSFAADDPYVIMHNKNEGIVEFTNLLFIPTNKTFDLFHPDRKRRVKLYIKRVFISDENIDIVPQYLRFVRGVVDSEDLPLNISRETLQHNSTLEKIKAAITKRILSELLKKQKDDRENYQKFWENFGAVLKEGLCEAVVDHEKLLDTCLFRSALNDKMITLGEYIEKMKSEQKEIFYLSGEDPVKLKNSPQIEGFLQKGIDVLLFTDSVDDFWVQNIRKYKDFDIKSVTRSDIELEKDADIKPENNKEVKNDDLIAFFKEILQDIVSDVKISRKLTSSPSCLSIPEGSMDIRMERYLVEQKQLPQVSAKILELNPEHDIVKKIKATLPNKKSYEDNVRLVNLLYDQACIIEGEPIRDPALFCKQVNAFIASFL